jgi:hypothetical protein
MEENQDGAEGTSCERTNGSMLRGCVQIAKRTLTANIDALASPSPTRVRRWLQEVNQETIGT